MYVWVQRLDLDISGHADTYSARATTYIRSTTFNNICATTTTTATTSFLCEWFVCAGGVSGHSVVLA